jgi:hypothetical protein
MTLFVSATSIRSNLDLHAMRRFGACTASFVTVRDAQASKHGPNGLSLLLVDVHHAPSAGCAKACACNAQFLSQPTMGTSSCSISEMPLNQHIMPLCMNLIP